MFRARHELIAQAGIGRRLGRSAIRRDQHYLDTVEEIWQGLKQYVE